MTQLAPTLGDTTLHGEGPYLIVNDVTFDNVAVVAETPEELILTGEAPLDVEIVHADPVAGRGHRWEFIRAWPMGHTFIPRGITIKVAFGG